jgi:hypothetical protein
MVDRRSTPAEAPRLRTNDARGARPGVPVLWVLIISTVVALVAGIIIWASFSRGPDVDQPSYLQPPAPSRTPA